MTSEFTGKTILVTGAASGIGAATAQALAAAGAAHLLLVDCDAEQLAAHGPACPVTHIIGDVADPSLWERIEREGTVLDAAVLNAGIAGETAVVEKMSLDNWRRVMAVNLDGAFLSLRTGLRLMRDGGAVVLTASIAGSKPQPGTAAYGASKAGVIQLARVAALEGAKRQIRVNAIAPGGVDTAIWDDLPIFKDLLQHHRGDRAAAMATLGAGGSPLGRFASAEEIAGQVLFLLSDAARTVTGSTFVSDGGYGL